MGVLPQKNNNHAPGPRRPWRRRPSCARGHNGRPSWRLCAARKEDHAPLLRATGSMMSNWIWFLSSLVMWFNYWIRSKYHDLQCKKERNAECSDIKGLINSDQIAQIKTPRTRKKIQIACGRNLKIQASWHFWKTQKNDKIVHNMMETEEIELLLLEILIISDVIWSPSIVKSRTQRR